MKDLRAKIRNQHEVLRNLNILLNNVRDNYHNAVKVQAEIYKQTEILKNYQQQLTVEGRNMYRSMAKKILTRPHGCECGAHHTSFPNHHSDWCPKYRKIS